MSEIRNMFEISNKFQMLFRLSTLKMELSNYNKSYLSKFFNWKWIEESSNKTLTLLGSSWNFQT